MQLLTGNGDLPFAMQCLELVRRDARSVDDVTEVVQRKRTGRRIENNGYIRKVIEDHCGATPEMEALEQEKSSRQEADAAGHLAFEKTVNEQFNSFCMAVKDDKEEFERRIHLDPFECYVQEQQCTVRSIV